MISCGEVVNPQRIHLNYTSGMEQGRLQMRKTKTLGARKKLSILSSLLSIHTGDKSRLIAEVGQAVPKKKQIVEDVEKGQPQEGESPDISNRTDIPTNVPDGADCCAQGNESISTATVVDETELEKQTETEESVRSGDSAEEVVPADTLLPTTKVEEFVAVQIEEDPETKHNLNIEQREEKQPNVDVTPEPTVGKIPNGLAAVLDVPVNSVKVGDSPPGMTLTASGSISATRVFDGWAFVKQNLSNVIKFGVAEGLIPPREKNGSKPKKLVSNMKATMMAEGYDVEQKAKAKESREVNIPVNEVSLLYEAIPFLPLLPAVLCCVLNFILPGVGSILCGFFLLCVGQPRIQMKEGRVFMSIIVNVFCGIAQFGTITFLLVGYFWSVAWGLLLLTHSLRYREALKEKKQTQVATEALELLTKDTLLRRKEVKELVRAKNTGKVLVRAKAPLPPSRQTSDRQQHLSLSAVPNVPPDQTSQQS